jgi:exopolyphosphatase/guanosine-5'-triphosphate,3'-diphosphate pyrophosphatase
LNDQLAAIDIGTNSALLLIAERRSGVLEPVRQRIAAPRVGRNLAATGVISDGPFGELMAALKEFQGEIAGCGANLVGAVATQAFREATNGPALLFQVSALLGLQARILEGPEESRLGYLAVANRHPMPNLAVLDIGGGSTEVTRKGQGMSLPVGAVSLLEACGSDVTALRERAAAAFHGALEEWKGRTELIAVGGTASALAMLELKLPAFDAIAIEGMQIEWWRVTENINNLAVLSAEERAALPGMDPGRVDILMPGLCILEAFLQTVGCQDFRVSDRGIRYGVIIDWLKRQSPKSEPVVP